MRLQAFLNRVAQPAVNPRAGLVSSASLTLATRVAAFAFSLATNVLLARSLGPEGRGVYAVAVLIPALIGLALQLGLGQANVYHLSKRLLDADELIGHSFALAAVLGGAGYLAVWGYITLTGASTFAGIGTPYVLVSCLALPFTLLVIFLQGVLNGAQRYALWNSVLLTQYASPTLALAAALIFFGTSTLAAVVAWTASTAITAAVATYHAASLGRLGLRLRLASLKQLLRFGLVGYLGSLTSFVNYRFDVLLVNAFAGARQVGLYAVGTGLAEVVWYLANAAGIVLAPKVASTEREQGDRMTEAVCRVVTLLALLSGLVLAIAAPFAVVIFFGSAFAESAWAVWLLLPGIVTFSIARVLSMYLLGRDRLRVDLLASFIGLVVTLVLDLVLIPRFGFRGAAVASTIAYTCTMAVDLRWVVRNSTMSLERMLLARPDDLSLLVRRVRQAISRG